MKKNYPYYFTVMVIGLFTLQLVNAQTTYDWLDTAPDNNWRQGAFGARWNPGNLFDEPPFGILRFNNNHELTMTNNVGGGYTFHKMVFGSFNTNNRTISGNDLFFFDFSGTDPEIENLSTGSHTINCNITGDNDGDPLIIDAQSGNITLNGTLNNNSSFIDVSGNGGHNVAISGVISGSGGLALKDNTILTLSGDNTYTGATIVEGGTLILQNNVANSSFTVQSGATLQIEASLTVDAITVQAGGYLQVNSGVTLTATNGITLSSSAMSYSSLILDGSITGTVSYERFVNSSTNGNDLISSPLPGQTWASFLSSGTNATDLLNAGVGPTTYAFAPFDKSVSDYVNFTSATSATLDEGRGYRAATNAGTTLTFTGAPLSGTVSFNIEDTGASFADWNLIGNPYPSYVSIQAFLEHEVAAGISNISLFESASGIYGYDGDVSDGWNVITLANDDGQFFAPGQGFFVAADAADVLAHDVEFTAAMRSSGTGDDFIVGRTNNTLTFAEINISTASSTYSTEVYFDANASLGLDPGYDATIFGGSAPSFAIYSHLVQDNTGIPMALQAVGLTDLSDVTIPLGVNANVGEELTFDMTLFSLPPNIEVYLDDNDAGISTLLNSSDYVLTPASNLTGVGRFFLRFTDSALSTAEHNFDAIAIYTDKNSKTINISGYLVNTTQANIYDMQGRLVRTKALDINVNLQSIDMSSFTSGIYIVELSDDGQSRVEKVILP